MAIKVRPQQIGNFFSGRRINCAGRAVFSGSPDTTYPGGISTTVVGSSIPGFVSTTVSPAWTGGGGVVEWYGAFSEALDPARVAKFIFSIGGIGWRDPGGGFDYGAGSTTIKLQLITDPDWSSANITSLTYSNKPAASGDSWTQASSCEMFQHGTGAGQVQVIEGSALTQDVTITGAALTVSSYSGVTEPLGSISSCFAIYLG